MYRQTAKTIHDSSYIMRKVIVSYFPKKFSHKENFFQQSDLIFCLSD